MTNLSKAEIGTQAEVFVVERLGCPSCRKPLRALPKGFPLYDVECSHCLFRAQVKRVRARPRDRIRGATWDVISHHIKTGHLIPPMFACFGWPETQPEPETVWFFPFIPVSHVKKRVLSENHSTPGRKMTEYVLMRSVPHLVVFDGKSSAGQ